MIAQALKIHFTVEVSRSLVPAQSSVKLTFSNMPIDLYHMEASAPCRAVVMTAKMIGVELNIKMTNLMAGDHMKPEFLAINPQHNIPTIGDDGFYLNESKAISAYLINRYAKDDTLYPKDPKFRALVDQRLYFDMGVLYRRFGELYYPVMMGGATKLSDAAKKELSAAIDFLEGFLGSNKYAAGDHLTIADIALVSTVSTIEVKLLLINTISIQHFSTNLFCF
uniref:Glutathione S-transferase 1-1 n=1 Tax=Daphnia magna TaxID=35525 RepID=A0A0N7ZPQ5_9CRUS